MAAIGSLTDEDVAEQLARACQKARYPSRDAALEGARDHHRKLGRGKGHPYRCRDCSGAGQDVWHLTTADAGSRAFHRRQDRRRRR